jgi:hypothetical protein
VHGRYDSKGKQWASDPGSGEGDCTRGGGSTLDLPILQTKPAALWTFSFYWHSNRIGRCLSALEVYSSGTGTGAKFGEQRVKSELAQPGLVLALASGPTGPC